MTALTTVPSSADLEGVTRDVWTSFLEGDSDDAGLVAGGEGVADERVTACVHLSGAFTGSVTVQCSDSAARDAAAVLFAIRVEEVTDIEVVDAIGEIANMVGGNVKAMLPGPSSLSLPAVAQGHRSSLTVAGASVIRQVHLMWRTEPVVITLWQQA
jgi:chemotaxis protein CheX